MRRVIDVHIHLSERRDDALRPFAEMNGLKYTLDELLHSMQEHSVVHGLLLSPPLRDWDPLPNDAVVKLCSRSGGVLSPVLTVEPTPRQVKRAVGFAKELGRGAKAFKIRLGYVKAGADSKVFAPLYDYAESVGLPVLFHTGDTASTTGKLALSHPLTLDELANKREELKMVLCHFGNPWFDDVAELIYKHQNVYADISGLTTGGGSYPKKFAEWLARRLSEAVYFAGGAEKILFGTDYPVTRYPDALEVVERMEIKEADREMILWRNASKVFGL